MVPPEGRRPTGIHLLFDDDCYGETDLMGAYGAGMQTHVAVDVLEGAIQPVGECPNGMHHALLNLQGDCLWSCNMFVLWRRSEQWTSATTVLPRSMVNATECLTQ